jgi:hypothetical protein
MKTASKFLCLAVATAFLTACGGSGDDNNSGPVTGAQDQVFNVVSQQAPLAVTGATGYTFPQLNYNGVTYETERTIRVLVPIQASGSYQPSTEHFSRDYDGCDYDSTYPGTFTRATQCEEWEIKPSSALISQNNLRSRDDGAEIDIYSWADYNTMGGYQLNLQKVNEMPTLDDFTNVFGDYLGEYLQPPVPLSETEIYYDEREVDFRSNDASATLDNYAETLRNQGFACSTRWNCSMTGSDNRVYQWRVEHDAEDREYEVEWVVRYSGGTATPITNNNQTQQNKVLFATEAPLNVPNATETVFPEFAFNGVDPYDYEREIKVVGPAANWSIPSGMSQYFEGGAENEFDRTDSYYNGARADVGKEYETFDNLYGLNTSPRLTDGAEISVFTWNAQNRTLYVMDIQAAGQWSPDAQFEQLFGVTITPGSVIYDKRELDFYSTDPSNAFSTYMGQMQGFSCGERTSRNVLWRCTKSENGVRYTWSVFNDERNDYDVQWLIETI